jgi:hypothetical protein
MSKLSEMMDNLSPACDEGGYPITQRQWGELRQQLATSKEELSRARLQNAIVYGTSHPEMYKTVEDELREQVTLLRASVEELIPQNPLDTEHQYKVHHRALKALTTTETKP